jgi:phospho-N-acetylmuramoyl-pentapeptide-transferase
MIYWLSQQLVDYFSFLNVFSYVTVGAMFAVITAFVIGWLAGPAFIRRIKLFGGQPVRDDGPQSHLQKNDTPTMGGVLMLFCLLVSCLLWGDLSSGRLWLALVGTILFGAIGLADDCKKVFAKNAKGLSARSKLALQSAVAAAVLIVILYTNMIDGFEGIIIPYTKNIVLTLGTAGFVITGYLALVGASNAVNLTDGLDGLAIMPVIMVAAGLALYAYVSGHAVFAAYLGLPHLLGTHELVIFCAALIGAGLAFLWFNAHPAAIFMGDVGALAAGGALALVAVLVRQEIVFIIMSGIFVMEAVSVILQVGSFKLTGRRIFRMAPLHHHFELKGWKENQVVVRFWIISLMFVLAGLAALKLR